MTIERIENTNLFIGNSNDSRDINRLRQLGINSVVNVAKDLEGPWFHGEFWNYKIPLYDGPGNKLWQITMAVDIINTLLSNGEKVLVHCHSGMSRSPSIVALVLAVNNICPTLEEAFNFVKTYRSIAHAHAGLWPIIEQGYLHIKK
jgi:protein tyrosine phosphatase (PTP) superfamily phosphohydrolase (DUF442 family)